MPWEGLDFQHGFARSASLSIGRFRLPFKLATGLGVAWSTSKIAREWMTVWREENIGCFGAAKLDVRDLGGHLDVTQRASAATSSNRVKVATSHVIAVGALPMGFNECLGWCTPNTYLVGCMGVGVLPFP